jgi:hypothetical protein
MRYWVGSAFAQHAVPVGIVLLIGIWINGISYIPFTHLQAIERPDVVAKFHAIELLPFLGVLWLGLHYFGLLGAAYAWTFRVTIDGLLLFWASNRIPHWPRIIPGFLLVLCAAFFAPSVVWSSKTGAELILLAIATIWSWKISPGIRAALQFRARKLHDRAVV